MCIIIILLLCDDGVDLGSFGSWVMIGHDGPSRTSSESWSSGAHGGHQTPPPWLDAQSAWLDLVV